MQLISNRWTRESRIAIWIASTMMIAGGALPAMAQETGGVAGQVVSSEGEPVEGAQVRLVEPRLRTRTGADGRFAFGAVPAGTYFVEATSPRFGQATQRVSVEPGVVATLRLELDWVIHRDQIVVTAAGTRGIEELAQPVGVLSNRELMIRLQPTLGETLAQEPGIAASGFAPGSSRPVIRGLGGDRIRVLQHGIDPGDASTTSPDHAVAIETQAAERIEILRGPATLLYGSSAIGGVINVLDRRIPDHLPDRALSGMLELRGGTVANERGGSLDLSGALSERLAWHLDFAGRRTGDYRIPGPAEVEDHDDHGHGHSAAFKNGDDHHGHRRLENSALETVGGSAGLSYIGSRGYLGVAVSGFDSHYGVPGHAHGDSDDEHDHGHGHLRSLGRLTLASEDHHDEGHEDEDEVEVELKQRRVDLRGSLDQSFGIFRGVGLKVGFFDYEHQELEDHEVETEFTNRGWEARLEAPHRELGRLTGTLGLQAGRRDFSAVGEEAFVPPTKTDSLALFAFEELASGPWTYQFGGRLERQSIQPTGGGSRSFTSFSSSGAILWSPVEATTLSLSLARSAKHPNAEELFSDGPHLATGTFEVGNPDLGREVGWGLDLGWRQRLGIVTGELHLFANRYEGFIFPERTGHQRDGLDELRYVQRDADFVGGELHLDIELFHTDPHHLELEIVADYVRAELRDTGEALPRIPPFRLGAGLRYESNRLWGLAEVRRVFEQDRTAPFETHTDGYTMVNASVGYRFFWGDRAHDLVLRGTNLTNTEARNHVSFQKDRVPQPGRDISLAYRLFF